MNKILDLLASDIATDLLVLTLLIMIGSFVYAQLSKSNKFDIQDALLDSKTGKISIHNLAQFIALIISSWGFIYQALHQQLTDWFFLTYMSIWAGAGVANTFMNRPPIPGEEHHDGQ